MKFLKGKTILITGGLGSFGYKFIEIVLKEHDPKSIRVYDNRELASVEADRNFNDSRLRFFIGDVRDKERLNRAMNNVDLVVHAAALKHVPICEYNPVEAIKTNIDGAINVVEAAIDNKVEKVIAISTDKAVYPVNLYGATKAVAEKIFIQSNSYRGSKNILMSVVRYGNVIASSGSVIPLFLKQKQRGRITITDERMTRFWITLEQGIRFVVDCVGRMKGGEIFIPKIPSMKIIDLAEAVAPGAEKEIVGIRPGEKLREVLIAGEEADHAKEYEDYYVIEPEYHFWQKSGYRGGKKLAKNFCYSSDTNSQWLTVGGLRKIIGRL